jgi:hypothetical protein
MICYRNVGPDELRCARSDGAAWIIDTVDSGEMEYTSLAVHGSGLASVGYYDMRNGELKHARWDGLTWTVETVATNSGRYLSLVVDASGNPAIAFTDAIGELTYAYHDGTSWSFEPLGVGVGLYISMVLDSAGEPHIAYATPFMDVNYVYREAAVWSDQTLDSLMNRPENLSLGLDGGGRPFISYSTSDCGDAVVVARLALDAVLYRGVVGDLSTGWKTAALPLDASRDDPMPPFPVDTALGSTETDPSPPSAPLVLYRVLVDGTGDAGNVLRAAKSVGLPGAVALVY